jgi:hypothetical protein
MAEGMAHVNKVEEIKGLDPRPTRQWFNGGCSNGNMGAGYNC